MQTSYHRLSSATLIAKIRSYIAEHLQDTSETIQEAPHEIPQLASCSFEEEGDRHELMRCEVRKEPMVIGATDDLPDTGTQLDHILSRLKKNLDKPQESFSARLLRLIDERGMTDAEAYKRAGVDRKYFSKIRNGQTPSVKVIYAFIFVLGLNIDEARDLLASAGYTISPAREYDLIMEFCIIEGCDIDTVNGALFELGLPLLSG